VQYPGRSLRLEKHPLRRRLRRAWRAVGAAGAAALLAPALAVGGASAAHAATSAGFTAVIAPGFAPGTLAEPAGGSAQPANIVTAPASRFQPAEQWAFLAEPGTSGQYEIQNVYSGLCITTNGIPGSPVQQQVCYNNENQRWNVNEAEPPLGTIRSAWNGPHGRLYLSTKQLAYNGGATLTTYGVNSDDIFWLGQVPGDGFYTGLGLQLSGGGTGVLDVSGGSAQAGAEVILDSPVAPLTVSQEWAFTNEGNDNYEILDANSGLCLTTNGNPGDPVEQQRCLGNPNQLWYTSLNPSSGSQIIYSDYYGSDGYLVLESQGAYPQLGDVVDTWGVNEGSNQLFYPISIYA
jgi:hypothetical protein